MPKGKPRARTRTCEVPMCGAVIEAGRLMCKEHWYEVPRDLRRQINNAWRLVKGGGSRSSRQACLAEYRAAVRDAVAAVEGKRP